MEKIETGNWKLETGDGEIETGNWKLETGDGEIEIGNWKLETGDGENRNWKPEIRNWGWRK
jgi:hypothetical protein